MLMKQKKIVSLTKSVEAIYHKRNLNSIAPLSFTLNLKDYSMGGSKMVTAMLGNSGPYGDYN